jgi:hypothetical protein
MSHNAFEVACSSTGFGLYGEPRLTTRIADLNVCMLNISPARPSACLSFGGYVSPADYTVAIIGVALRGPIAGADVSLSTRRPVVLSCGRERTLTLPTVIVPSSHVGISAANVSQVVPVSDPAVATLRGVIPPVEHVSSL